MPLSVPMLLCHKGSYTLLAVSELMGLGQRLIGLPVKKNCNTPPTTQEELDAATFIATEMGHLAIMLTHKKTGLIVKAIKYPRDTDGYLSLDTTAPADDAHVFNVTTIDADDAKVSIHSTYLEKKRSFATAKYPIMLSMSNLDLNVPREGMLPRHRVYAAPGEFRPIMHDKEMDRDTHLACEDPDSDTCTDRVAAGYPECGDRAKRLHWDEKERLLFCDFRGPPARTVSRKRGKRGAYNPAEVDFAEEDGWTPDGVPVINDVCPQAHRLHQFGAGRWKFTVENPLAKNGDYYDDYEGYEEDWKGAATLELFKPLQPYLLTWEVLQFSPGSEGGGGKGGKKGAKKPMSVKAMPDWRNPLGFACHVVREGAPQQFLGVCASVQGLEAGGSAFVAGATVLGLNHLPLLLVTLDPRKWQLQLGYDPQSGEVRAIKIMHYEIVLPPGTLTSDVIWKVNDLRMKVLEAMTPWEQDEEEKYRRGRGRRGQDQYIWVGEIREEMDELLEEIWDTPDPVVKSKKMQWAAGAGDHVSEVLALLQPLLNVEEIEYFATTAVQKSAGNAGKQGASSSKASKQKQSGSGGGQSLKRQGVSAEDVKKVEKVLQYLRNNGEAKLSRICGSFYTSPKVLAKYPDLLELSKKGRNNEETVRLVGSSGGGGRSQQGSFAAQQSSGGGWRQQSSGRSYGAGAAAAMEARVNELCRQEGVSCEATDFDRVVKNWIKEFAARRGSEYIQEAFGHLAEWCARKERHEVKNWKGYIMVLLRNWEAERWPREPDDEDDDR
eukprot:TRINITY_DN7216_c0_g1_i1.p1 TRINITY_DN7216_c0_g1~~TRINITY_DN7216_c0_g1_i1.p1  ORF type:complete len:776 (-),score=173.00 TRINITY_DN7216_c0_g1_i1:290-2617(-)